jgi:hypothetical protein
MNTTMPSDTCELTAPTNSKYTLFFATPQETYALRIESMHQKITFGCIAARSKQIMPRPTEFDILGFIGDEKGTTINIVDNDAADGALYSIIGYSRYDTTLHITIKVSHYWPDTAIVVVNDYRTTLMKHTPLLGHRTKTKIAVHSESIVGSRVVVCNIRASSKYTILNGVHGTIVDVPQVDISMAIPVKLDKKPAANISRYVLIKKAYLLEK